MNEMFNNPFLHIGAGILAANRPGASFGEAVGGGLLGGIGSYQQMVAAALARKRMEREMEERERIRAAQGRVQQSLPLMGQEMAGPVRPGEQPGVFAGPSPADVLQGYGFEAYQSTLPTQPALTDDIREYTQASQQGYQGSFMDYMRELKGPPSTSVEVNTAPPLLPSREAILREDMTFRAEKARESNESYVQAAAEAARQIPKLQRARQLLNTAYTGPFAEALLSARKLGNLLDIPVDVNKIRDQEQLRTFLGDQVMARVSETKGAVSEKEMDLFTQYSANYGNTVEGNKAIIDFQLARMKRDAEIARKVQNMRRQNKTSLEIRQAVDDYIAENDLSGLLTEPSDAAPTGDDPLGLYERRGNRGGAAR